MGIYSVAKNYYETVRGITTNIADSAILRIYNKRYHNTEKSKYPSVSDFLLNRPNLLDDGPRCVLVNCNKEKTVSAYKETAIYAGSPPFEEYHDAVYFPSKKKHWPVLDSALYERKGHLIESSCTFRGINKKKVTKVQEFREIPAGIDSMPGNYVYLGALVDHFGHFMTEALARIWYLAENPDLKGRLVFHGDSKQQKAYMRDFFSLFGIDERRIFIFDRPVKLERVIVPFPSMSNMAWIYEAHKKAMEYITDTIFKNSDAEQSSQPVYLSRTKLSPRQRLIYNEKKIESYMARKNAKIVYPEQLNLQQQIQLWNTHPIFIGPIGSAHHGTLFALQPKTNVYLCENPLRNFMMIDALKENKSYYLSCLDYFAPFQPKTTSKNSNMIIDCELVFSAFKDLSIV